jgi:hypothetical protein
MIDHVWTVLCSRVIVDQKLNNVSLINILEQLNIKGEPLPDGVLPCEIHVATLWARSDFQVPAVGHGRLLFLSPSGESLLDPFEHEIDLREKGRNRNFFHLSRLPVHEPGRHEFCLDYRLDNDSEWHRVAVLPLQVNFRPKAESE